VDSNRSKKSSRSAASKKANLHEAANVFAQAMVENMATLKEEDYDSYSLNSH
jgi:hypothetical protein